MSQVNRAPSLASAALRWQRDSMRARGLVGSLRYLAEQFVECAKDSLPERRRSRFGDIDYDCDHAVDTTWARLPFSVRLREIFSERLYQPTVEEEFAAIMQHLATVDFETFTFIDLGSGKGRALLMASDYPFRKIIGVELLPALHRAAEENVKHYRSDSQQCFSLESILADATVFPFPEGALVLYLFNPFPESGLRRMITNLEQDLQSKPRTTYVLYHNPQLDTVLIGNSRFKKIAATHQYSIYSIIL